MKKIVICIFIIILTIVGILIEKIFFSKQPTKNIEKNNIEIFSDEDNLLLYIDEVKKKKNNNNNITIVGRIISGTVNVKDEISIGGLGKKEIITQVIKLNVNGTDSNIAKSGENVSITIDTDVDMEHIQVGMAVITPKTDKPVYNVKAKISKTTMELKDIVKEVNVFYINKDIKCNVTIISEKNNEIKISLDVPIVVKKDLEIVLKNNDKIIANAIVIK